MSFFFFSRQCYPSSDSASSPDGTPTKKCPPNKFLWKKAFVERDRGIWVRKEGMTEIDRSAAMSSSASYTVARCKRLNWDLLTNQMKTGLDTLVQSDVGKDGNKR